MSIGENVDKDLGPAGGDSGGDLGGMSAEEQAQFDQMSRGEAPSGDREVELVNGDDDGDSLAGEGDIDHDGDADGDGDGQREPQQREPGDAPADGEVKKKPRVVGYGKYERETRKAAERATQLEKERDEARANYARMDERTRMLMEAINAKQPAAAAAPEPKEPEDIEPDAEQDPFGHAAWTRRELGRTQEQFRQFRDGQQTREQQTNALNEEQSLLRGFTSEIERAAQTKPEYAEAFVHMRESRFTELGYLFAGIDINNEEECKRLTPQQQSELSDKIQRTFHADVLEVAKAAKQSGQPVADHVFNLARARHYAPKPVQQQAPVVDAPRPNGKAPAAAAPAAAPSVTDQLAAMRDGQAASKSLSDAGGSPGGELSMERLLQMSDDEFSELHDTLSKRQFDRLMGKPRQ